MEWSGLAEKQTAVVHAVSPMTSMLRAMSLTTGAASSGMTPLVVVDESGVADERSMGSGTTASWLGHSDEQLTGIVTARLVALMSPAMGAMLSVIGSGSTDESLSASEPGVAESPA
jgi:hypothetical protein